MRNIIKSKVLLTLILLFITVNCFAQPDFFKIKKDDLFGINRWGSKPGDVEPVVKAKYQDVIVFNKMSAAALNYKGKWVIHRLSRNGSEAITDNIYDSIKVVSTYATAIAEFMILFKGGVCNLAKLTKTELTGVDKWYNKVDIINFSTFIVGEPGNYEVFSLYLPGISTHEYHKIPFDNLLRYKVYDGFIYFETVSKKFISMFKPDEFCTEVESLTEWSEDIYITVKGKDFKYHPKYNPPKWMPENTGIVDNKGGYFVTIKNGFKGLADNNGNELVKSEYAECESKRVGLARQIDLFFFSSPVNFCIYNTNGGRLNCVGKKVINKAVSNYFIFLQTEDKMWHHFNQLTNKYDETAYTEIDMREFEVVCYSNNGINILNIEMGKTVIELPENTQMVYYLKDKNFLVFKKENRYGWKTSKMETPAVFESVSHCFANLTEINCNINFKYKGILYTIKEANLDGKNLRCTTWGGKCSNSKCSGGVLGYKTETTEEKSISYTTESYTNEGKIIKTYTVTKPAVTYTTTIYCDSKIHGTHEVSLNLIGTEYNVN
jgi:hypothetical protein